MWRWALTRDRQDAPSDTRARPALLSRLGGSMRALLQRTRGPQPAPEAPVTAVPSSAGATTDVDMTAITRFIAGVAVIPHPAVVELGTRRQPGQGPTRHSVWVPHAASYVGVDYEPGEDVDIVADVHELSRHVGRDSVDAVVACSTFEHIKYPWIAATEIAKVLRRGGFVFVHTHQTFAIHAHPHDYWRFSMEGLEALFTPTLGFQILACHYQYPCRIVTADDPRQADNPSFLNVCLVARKVGPAPEVFVPDFGH